MAVIALLAQRGVAAGRAADCLHRATLGIHPLAVLIVTIAAGSLFGTIGLVLAAPLTAAGVRISAADLAHARAQAEDSGAGVTPKPDPGDVSASAG